MNRDGSPSPTAEIPEQVSGEASRTRVAGEDDGEQCRNQGKQRKLDVPDPKVGLGALEDHLEIDTCKPGGETGGGHSTKSFQRAHDVDMHRCGIMGTANWNVHRLVGGSDGGSGLDLDDSDTQSEETERHPLCRRKGLAQEDYGKGGGCENLHLVGDLECSDRKVADGDELKGVLDDVENGWD